MHVRKVLSFTSLAMLALFIASCDLFTAGLGAKVDLEPPLAKIIAPTPNSYVNGESFSVSGTASDDNGITSLTIRVKDTSGNVVKTTTVTPNTNGNWSSTFTTKKASDPSDALNDGQYTIDVTVSDGKGKTQNTFTSVIIDTIPPTVLVTSPLSKTGSQYTDAIDVKGEVYDATTVKDVKVSLLKADGSILAGPVTADGTNTWTTRFELKDKIAGLQDNETYYYNVAVTDAAGNSNTYYYHRVDILESKNDVNPNAYFPAMDEIGKIDQLGIKGATSGITAATLSKKRLSSVPNFGSFIYEAEPQIDFQFTNIDVLKDAEKNLLPPKSKVSGIVTPPADTGAIDKYDADSIKIEIYDYNEHLISTLLGNDAHVTLLSIGNSVNFSFALVDNAGSDLPPAKYKLKMYAKTDQNTTGHTNFFELMIDAEAPYFEETSIDANNMFRNAPFTMSFDGSHSTQIAKIEIYQAKGSELFPSTPNETITAGLPASNFTNKKSGSLPYGVATEGLYKYQAVLTTVGGKTATLLRSVYYDTTPPNVEITSFNKYATANKVNKTVTFNAIAGDLYGVEGVKYFISTNGSNAPAYDATVGGAIVQVLAGQSIDTTTLTDGTTYYLWVVAKDKAGNEGHAAAQQFVVDQSTDKPVVTFTSVDPTVITEDKIRDTTTNPITIKNLLVSGGKISGTITDDDGLPDTATLYIDKNKDGDFTDSGEAISLDLAGSNLTKSFSLDISDPDVSVLSEGTYRFYIDVADTADGEHNASMTPIWFAYDTAVPTVVFNPKATDDNAVGPYRNGDFTVQGTVLDANGISKVEFSFDNGTTWENFNITADPGENKAWTKTITAASNNGEKTLVVRATDKFGRKNQSSAVTVWIDTIAPTVSITNPGSFVAGLTVTVAGTSSDSTGGSGIQKIRYRVDGGTWQEDVLGTTNWLATLDLDTDGAGDDSGLSEGLHTIEAQAIDNAGNLSSVKSITLMVDQNVPTITNITIDGSVFNDDTTEYRTSSFSLGGTAVDTNGVASVSITQKKEGGTTTVDIPVTLGSGTTTKTWSAANITLPEEGSFIYTITVTDVANRSTSVVRKVSRDTQKPVAPSITNPGNTWLFGSTYEIKGTASDVGSAGIGTVYYVIGPVTGFTPPADLGSWTPANGKESWSDTINLTGLGVGEKKLFVKAVDKAGNISDQTELIFGIDQNTPVITLNTPSGNLANAAITFTGTASDDYLVDHITVAEKKPGNINFTDIGTAEYNSGTGDWNYNRNITGLSDGIYEYRFTVFDKANKPSSVTKTITIDTTSPVVSFNQPAPYINLSGTVYGNGLMTFSGSASDTNGLGSLFYRVGGGSWQPVGSDPYTTFTFTVDTTAYSDKADLTVEVRGIDKAGNSGIATYTIRVDQDTDKPELTIGSPAEGATVASQTITISGTLTDDDGLNSETLYYRLSADNGTTWSPDWTQIPASNLSGSSTSKTLSSFSFTNSIDGAKILQIKISDINGKVNTKTIAFTQDAGAPTISGISPATTGYRNADFMVSGTATDTTGTVAAVRYKVVKDGATVVVNWTPCTLTNPNTPSTSFNTNLIPTASGTGIYQVTLETEDNAGNKRQESYAYTVDRTAPTGSFTSPGVGSTTNNIITLSGTSTDNYGVQALRLAIVKGGAEVANLGSPTGTTEWTLSFDTRNYDETTYATLISGSLYEITLRLIVTDVAGNNTNVDRTFRIDQSTDVPQISFTTQQNTFLSDSKVYGTASDDDGIASVEVSTDNGISWISLTAPTGGWGTTANWNYDLGANDGTYTLIVRVTDTSSPAITGLSSAATFKVDREAPDGTFTAPDANSKLKASELVFTGTYGDENGVSKVELKIDSTDFTSGTVLATMSNGSGSISGTWSYTFTTIPDGTRTIYARITDAAGRTTLVSRTVVVDTTGPVVSIIDPVELSSVYGKVTIRGSAEDATTQVRNIKIGIGKTVNETNYEGSPWYPATGTVSWSYTFNNINAYANTTYAVDIGDTDGDGIQDAGETWLNIWRMKVYIRAEDTAGLSGTGNIAYVSSYTLEIDPNRDRPEVTILDPDDGATVGGYKRIFGIAQDGQSIWKVQIAFDINNDGDFTDVDDKWPSISGFNPPSVDENDSSTTAWYVVNGTTSWYQTINLYGEFNPTGTATTKTIKFKVRAWDYKTTPGDGIPGIEVIRTITFDKTVPQYADLSHETNSTVGGSFTITGYVRDESGLQSIIFKHEGPRISSQELIGAPAGGPRAVLVNSGEPGYVAGYQTYRIEVPINTTEAGLFPNSSGIMAVAFDAIDTSGFHSIQSLSFNVDNIQPTNLTYTAGTEIIGSQAEVQGTVKDTGVISGIKQVVVYLQQGTSVLRLKGTGVATLPFSGVLDLNDPTYDDYRIVIDNRLEDGNDSGSAGDKDGYAEWLTISGGSYQWAAQFNSTLVADGKVEVHYVAYDFAGNNVSGSTNAYVANHKPIITSIVLGTDLNGDGDVLDANEQTSPISNGYGATNFTARGNKLYFKINSTGGNGTIRYSVKYGVTEYNSNLTSSEVTIDTSGFVDSSSSNDRTFTILVYDSTTSDDGDPTDELSGTITVGLTIDNVDEVAPTARLNQLSATDVKDYNASDRSVWKGHIEPWDQSPWDNQNSGFNKTNEVFGNDADVSGTIVFSGEASDNQRISALYIWIDLNGNGVVDGTEEQQVAEFSSSNNGLVARTNTLGTWSATSQSLSLESGHTVSWKFEWDSSTVNGVARSNVRIRVRAEDAKAGSPNSSIQTPTSPNDTTSLTGGFNIMKVDVVPYITDVVTLLNTLLGSDYNRSADGKYPVWVKTTGTASYETITVKGFNLAPTTLTGALSDIRISKDPDAYDATYTTKQGTGLTAVIVTANRELTVTLATGGSGYLTIIANGIPSLNSINNDTLPTNAMVTPLLQTSLNDDVYLSVWDYNPLRLNASAPRAKNAVYPSMAMSGNTPQFAYVNNSEGYGLAQYWDGTSEIKIYENWDLFTFTSLALNTDNNRAALYDINVVQLGTDFIGDKGGIMVNLYYNPPNTTWNGTTYFYRDYNVWLDNLYKSGNLAVLDRYQYPTVKLVGNSSLSHVFYSTYDSIDDRIIFRYFKTGTNQTSVGGGVPANATKVTDTATNLYVNNTEIIQSNQNGTWPVYTDNETNNRRFNQNNNAGNTNAGQYIGTGTNLGIYSAVVGVSTGASTARAVLIYYSGTTLYYIYATNDANTTWSTPVSLDTNCGGAFVSVVVDKDSHVHIAYQDSFNGDVVYIYIPTYNDPTTRKRVIVDSYLTVGDKLTLTVPTNSNTPYISYKGVGNTAKIAWYKGTPDIATLTDGVVDSSGKLNGKWEVQILPYRIIDSDTNRFNVGVGTNGLPVVGYCNNIPGAKGVEYLTALAELNE
ncbi:Ig-like domain-containing protein [Gracilinema caldarium]|uniref:Ig-like domain-containing protein n=1 Tax=Gracilinema caldarium (strain ATCC 51460 / DSM 7334 / H1) TaxID=744872 RepID=F8EXW2_GRAC1|nr:Ig-like domain-containing protein [Gracilinema caldarium]AEJ20126.1 hypothetical protein Spica_1998 [Gracilinema caldarium DSM 7334]